jgi:very-short-patch-repair endonuclease
MRVDSLVACQLRDLIYPDRGSFRYSVGQILERDNGVELEITGRKKERCKTGHIKKFYNVKCRKCRDEHFVSESCLDRGDSCRVCSKGFVVKGISDINSCNPQFAEYLVNKEDGDIHTMNYQKSLDIICPQCNKVIKQIPYYVNKIGFYCYHCGDGVSYPNKYTYEVLKGLGVGFEYEKRFEWCVFKSFQSNELTYGRYDFVIEQMKLIIEVDGGLGHGRTVHSKSMVSVEETKYRDEQKDILAEKNGYRVVRIDANYILYKGRSKFMRNAIQQKLSALFDLSMIDWNEVDLKAQNSMVYKAVELYESGMKVKNICKELGVSDHTIYDYLTLGNTLGICSYTPRRKVCIDSVEFAKSYEMYK